MKFINKLVICSVIVFGISLCFMVFVYHKLTSDSSSVKNVPENGTGVHVVETENNISPPAGEKTVPVQYVLKLNGDIICAYVSEGGTMKLWNSTKKPLSLSKEDTDKLEKGLYTSSFEELCLFFESFAS